MTDDRHRIDVYLGKFDRCLIGTSNERSRAKAELVEHLNDAAEAGELTAALERLGPPEDAAAAFSRERTQPPAPLDDRLLAAAIDNLPLIGVTLGLLLQDVLRGSSNIMATFPPFVYLQIGGVCIAPLPFTPCGVYDGRLLYAVGIPLALAWSIVGLGILESGMGTTPGKRLMGLWVANDKGIRIPHHAGIIRRLCFLVGPFAWADWIPLLWGDRRRILDCLGATHVVTFKRPGQRQDVSEPSKANDV